MKSVDDNHASKATQSDEGIELAKFDHAGNLLDIERREFPQAQGLQWQERIQVLEPAEKKWKKEVGFEPHPISVKRFRFRDGSGINAFNWWPGGLLHPDDGEFTDQLDEPHSVIRRWLDNGQFEWEYVRDNCWLDRTGEVTDT